MKRKRETVTPLWLPCVVIGEWLLPCNGWKSIGNVCVFQLSEHTILFWWLRVCSRLSQSEWMVTVFREARETVPLAHAMTTEHSLSAGDQKTTPSLHLASSTCDRDPLTTTSTVALLSQGLFAANLSLRPYSSPLWVFSTTSCLLCYLPQWW